MHCWLSESAAQRRVVAVWKSHGGQKNETVQDALRGRGKRKSTGSKQGWQRAEASRPTAGPAQGCLPGRRQSVNRQLAKAVCKDWPGQYRFQQQYNRHRPGAQPAPARSQAAGTWRESGRGRTWGPRSQQGMSSAKKLSAAPQAPGGAKLGSQRLSHHCSCASWGRPMVPGHWRSLTLSFP